MEFGPRALGSRSIIADPRRPEMRDRINALVKMREAFRPFAPAVLESKAAEHFELDHPSPFMLETCQVISPLSLPAITHVDGSARAQTVNENSNPRFHALLEEGVHKPSFYDPIVNRAYGAMASHYSVAVIPARSKKPRDKAKVEQGVLLVQRWILARLRKQRFFSLAEANREIAALLVGLNDKAFKKLPGARRTAFEEIERTALKPLPAHPYQYADWKVARLGIDYHIELIGHHYSVPHRFAREQVDVRYTTATVEVFHRGTRIAAHAKSDRRGAHTTLTEHMPANHQAVTGWDPQRLRNLAATIGPHTDAVIQHLLGGRQHPQQAYRTCLGILRLAKDYGNQRLEAACSRAIDLKAPSYRFIDSTLKNGLDQQPSPVAVQPDLPLAHANVLGPDYYH
jgi:transposase